MNNGNDPESEDEPDDGKPVVYQDGDFSQRAAIALNSAYWTEPPEVPEPQHAGEDYLTTMKRLRAERELVFNAIVNAKTYADLTGEAKRLFDLAEEYIEAQNNDLQLWERMAGPIGFPVGGDLVPPEDDQ